MIYDICSYAQAEQNILFIMLFQVRYWFGTFSVFYTFYYIKIQSNTSLTHEVKLTKSITRIVFILPIKFNTYHGHNRF